VDVLMMHGRLSGRMGYLGSTGQSLTVLRVTMATRSSEAHHPLLTQPERSMRALLESGGQRLREPN